MGTVKKDDPKLEISKVNVGSKFYKFNPLITKESTVDNPSRLFDAQDFAKTKQEQHFVDTEEPHKLRRRLILKDHPEMRELIAPEPLSVLLIFGILCSQLWIAINIQHCGWFAYLVVLYCYGGTVNHTTLLLNHEISHDLCFGRANPKSIEGQVRWALNRAAGIITNFCTGVPFSISFRRYHLDHHAYQGSTTQDADLPVPVEMTLFQGTCGKLSYMVTQLFWYAVRPSIGMGKQISLWEIINILVQLGFNTWVVQRWGWGPMIYLLCSNAFFYIHVCGGHFIAEHYEFVEGFETYSYTGSCNLFNLNVGYHIEHHDFTGIAWSRIWKVRELAPEWYKHLPTHTSYARVIYNYIFHPDIGPWSRIVRVGSKKKAGANIADDSGSLDADI